MHKPVHLHRNRLHYDTNLLLLIIPPFVFVLVLYLFFSYYKNLYKVEELAVESRSINALTGDVDDQRVLGEGTSLDNEVQNLTK
ncbi:MAG: hypothetical protein ACC618_01990 [Patescibacteria group bacterium]